MIAMSFRFLAGRYHATPWGRHVNEGAIEWPPSPWRILRALVATWKRTLPNLPRAEVEPIFQALTALPEFVLPPASTGHTRHFMPWDKNWKSDKQHPRTLIFDTFAVLSRDQSVRVCWPDVTLNAKQREALGHILANLNILGRSESWCEAGFGDDADSPAGFVCRPLQGDVPTGHEIIRLLCPDPGSALADDRSGTITTKTAGHKKNKRTSKEQSTIYGPAWNLCMETLQLHKERWSDPPGSRWVAYGRPRDCFRIERKPRVRPAQVTPTIQAVRFALDSNVLPLVTETLPVAEAARRALMSQHGCLTEKDGVRGRSNVLSGKDEHSHPLTGHRHAFYLPTDEDSDGRLDHLTVYAPDGFGRDEIRALDRLRKLRLGWEKEGRHSLRVLLLGMGSIQEYRPGPLRSSREWISATPYLATRHAKTRGRNRIDLSSPQARANFLMDDLRSQLANVRPDLIGQTAEVVEVKPVWDNNQVFKVSERLRTIQFKRFRNKVGDDGGRRLAGAFRLVFDVEVLGPIVVGCLNHFGMGLFVPTPTK